MLSRLLHYCVSLAYTYISTFDNMIMLSQYNYILSLSVVFFFFIANFPFLYNVLRAFAMRTKNAANYALLEDKIAEMVEERLESIRQGELGEENVS